MAWTFVVCVFLRALISSIYCLSVSSGVMPSEMSVLFRCSRVPT